MPDGKKIRALLKEKNMTQAELARRSNVTEANISYIISQNRNVREKTLLALCKALDCSPYDIALEDKNGN